MDGMEFGGLKFNSSSELVKHNLEETIRILGEFMKTTTFNSYDEDTKRSFMEDEVGLIEWHEIVNSDPENQSYLMGALSAASYVGRILSELYVRQDDMC